MFRQLAKLFDDAGSSVKKGAQIYLFFFIIILVLTLLFSVASTTLGIALNSKWLIMACGVARVICTIILFALLAPAIVPASAMFGSENALEKFIARAKGVCYAELTVTLFILIFLDWIRASAPLLPILIILFLMLYAGSSVLTKKIMNPLLVIIFCGVILNLLFPVRFESIFRSMNTFDKRGGISQLNPTLAEIDNGDFIFFDTNTGKALVWYLQYSDTKRIELYNGPGYHPVHRVALLPVDEGIVAEYKQQLKKYITSTTTTVMPSFGGIFGGGEKTSITTSVRAEVTYPGYPGRGGDSTPATTSTYATTSIRRSCQVAVAIVNRSERRMIDANPVISKLSSRNISAIPANISFSEAEQMLGSSNNFLLHSIPARFLLLGFAQSDYSPNNISGQSSSFSGNASIRYSLISTETGSIASQATVEGTNVAFGIERAKEMAIARALEKLGERVSVQ